MKMTTGAIFKDCRYSSAFYSFCNILAYKRARALKLVHLPKFLELSDPMDAIPNNTELLAYVNSVILGMNMNKNSKYNLLWYG